MHDVFVSYSSEDREHIEPLVEVLRHAGWSVWWDRAIGVGAAFDREIEQALDEARCVVVAWSKTAVESEWVRTEAQDALERGCLVPVCLDDARPPLAFRRLQTIALDGKGRAAGFDQLKRAIAAFAPPPEVDGDLSKGREAYQRREWETAYQLLSSCDGRQMLAAEDIERLSWAAYWTARYDDTLAHLERAEAAYRRIGDVRGVARTGLHQARLHSERRNFAVSAGIFNRVVELLSKMPECAEHGLMACNLAQHQMGEGNLTEARASAERARDIGRRVGDRNSEAMGLLWLGRTVMLEGHIAEGIALQDEATAAATSGELDPYFSGYIYCAVINACRDRADWHRAAEWTERADRWSERESVGFFPGVCRVHRAEILRYRGALHDAERDVLRGCELLTAASPAHSAQGFRELAEIRLRLGDLVGADAACRSVAALGLEPQPALAKLRLARGDAKGALASIERALADSSPWHLGNHVNLLPAKVSIALAAGNNDAAKQALTDLEVLSESLGTPAAAAAAACARGEVELSAGRSDLAIVQLRLSVSRWIEEQAPYEAACAQCLLATAFERDADFEAAILELDLALSSFEKLGAELDVRRTKARLASLQSLQTSPG
jgi:tetratricopeptide (TPR) repeat protein